jgi:hypothetical protein
MSVLAGLHRRACSAGARRRWAHGAARPRRRRAGIPPVPRTVRRRPPPLPKRSSPGWTATWARSGPPARPRPGSPPSAGPAGAGSAPRGRARLEPARSRATPCGVTCLVPSDQRLLEDGAQGWRSFSNRLTARSSSRGQAAVTGRQSRRTLPRGAAGGLLLQGARVHRRRAGPGRVASDRTGACHVSARTLSGSTRQRGRGGTAGTPVWSAVGHHRDVPGAIRLTSTARHGCPGGTQCRRASEPPWVGPERLQRLGAAPRRWSARLFQTWRPPCVPKGRIAPVGGSIEGLLPHSWEGGRIPRAVPPGRSQ